MGRRKLLKRLKDEKPLLQIALDVTDKYKALDLALEAYALGFDIIELGTPLIKLHGLNSLKYIRDSISNAFILADIKIADASRLEIEIVKSIGIDVATVLAISSEEVVGEAVKAGIDNDVSVWIDLIHVDNVIERVNELKKFSPDVFILHVGIDIQKSRGVSAEHLEKELVMLKDKGFVIAVAGGLNDRSVDKLCRLGADILIVGGWITRSIDPVARMKRLVEVINNCRG